MPSNPGLEFRKELQFRFGMGRYDRYGRHIRPGQGLTTLFANDNMEPVTSTISSTSATPTPGTFPDSPVVWIPQNDRPLKHPPSNPAIETRSTETVRVLHVINGEHFSGAERVQQLLGNNLPQFGVDPFFACIKPGKFPSMCGLPEERVFEFPMRSRFDWSAIQSIIRFAKENRIGILHAHTPRSALVTGIVAARLRLPWVYHVHSPAARDSTRAWINRINDWVERFSLANCSKIVTVSRSLRREMLRQNWSRTRLIAIGNGVACQTAIDPDTRRDKSEWTLGMVALFRPRKGIEVLLHALSLLPKSAPRVTIQAIGGFETPEYEREVRELIHRLGLESQVELTGFTRDVTGRMRDLDGMILPSLFGEGMPMVVLEAMAVGVPILATRVEGTPEVVRDGIEGVLAEPQDPKSLADAIVRFTSSRSQWISMSHQAWNRHRSSFTDVRMAQRMARVYRSLTN